MRGFVLGFPGCKVQSVLCFLKGRISSVPQSSLFADTAMSRQDNFFLFLVKTCSMFWRDVYFYVDFKIALDFPYYCSIMVVLFL